LTPLDILATDAKLFIPPVRKQDEEATTVILCCSATIILIFILLYNFHTNQQGKARKG
jgi:hypothetical protein